MSEYYSGRREDVTFLIPRECKRVLEVGCGYGGFRDHFDSKVEYWGIEADESAADIASVNLTKVLKGNFESVSSEIPKKHFDLIVCNDVVEHMSDESWFFNFSKTLLNDSGTIIGSVPNVRYVTNLKNLLFVKDWRYVDSGILDRTHMRFFTEKSLRETLIRSGYDVIAVRGINAFNARSFSRKIAALAFRLALGDDVRFFQIAFKAKI